MNPEEPFLPLEKHLPALAGDGWRAGLRGLLERVLGIRRTREVGRRLAKDLSPGEPPFSMMIEEWGGRIDDRGVVPAIPEGPLIIISNHPFGGADAAVLAHLICSVRRDVRMLANSVLLGLPGTADWILPLAILEQADAAATNASSLRSAIRHLRSGGVLGMFPAGAVARWNPRRARLEDPPWSHHVARLALSTSATVLPVRFAGANPAWFHLLAAIHPLVRSSLILRASLALGKGRTISCHAGRPLTPSQLPTDPAELTAALRRAVESIDRNPGF